MIKRNKLIAIITFVLAILFIFSLSKNNAYEDYFSDYEQEPLISMDLQDSNLKDVLKIFSQQSGLNFIASEAIKDRKITLYLDKVSVDEALDKILSANNLTYEMDKQSNIFIVKELGKPGIETITKVFYLKYARVSGSRINSEIVGKISSGGQTTGSTSGSTGSSTSQTTGGIREAIEKILTSNGKIVEDIRTNSLIVIDVANNFPFIEQTITKLDIPTPQVMLEVEMLDVSKNIVDKLGFEFGSNPLTLIFTRGFEKHGAEFYIGAASDRGREGGLTLGRTYAHILDFLRKQTDTKYLARPRLLTLNNETAEIKITTDEVIGEQVTYDDQGNVSARTAERTETGVSLRVTPQINLELNEITMFIVPKVVEATTSAFGSTYRDPEERETKSLVKVKDGETIIVAGLIRSEYQEIVTKLPVLGDIPLLGRLFRHKNKQKDKGRELLVFITPHIISEPTFKEELSQLSTQGLNREQVPSSRVVEIDRALDKIEDKRL